MRRFIIHTLVILLILLIGISPFISTAIAGTIAEANGCQLDEGSIHPCIINGEDWGSDLYTFGVLGWLAIATIPLAVMAALAYLAIVIIVSVFLGIRLRRREAAASQTPSNITNES